MNYKNTEKNIVKNVIVTRYHIDHFPSPIWNSHRHPSTAKKEARFGNRLP